ncbi:hypothetical protein D1872_315240 [compost metagenome]
MNGTEKRERSGKIDRKQSVGGNKDARISGRQGPGSAESSKSNGGATSSRKSSMPASARKKDTDKDRKNKGAPKWLKEKRSKE